MLITKSKIYCDFESVYYLKLNRDLDYSRGLIFSHFQKKVVTWNIFNINFDMKYCISWLLNLNSFLYNFGSKFHSLEKW